MSKNKLKEAPSEIDICMYDIPELLEGEYNLYDATDGALETSIDNIIVSEDDKEWLRSRRRSKKLIGKLELINKEYKFKRL